MFRLLQWFAWPNSVYTVVDIRINVQLESNADESYIVHL